LFVGLSTLDVIQRVEQLPGPNAKATALRQDVAGGGPALNAAVVFAALGGRATLLTRLGRSGIARLVRDDLAVHGVEVLDLADDEYVPAVSTVVVQDDTGDRRVVSTDARGSGTPGRPTESLQDGHIAEPLQQLEGIDVVHLDGHHADLAMAAARWGHERADVRVVDAGRWKPVLGELVPLSTDVICSADFAVPDGCQDPLPWLLGKGVGLAAVTAGAAAVRWATPSAHGTIEPGAVTVVDTLGAGDFFHGAYSFARTVRDEGGRTLSPSASLTFAGRVAALKCAQPGTRDWLGTLKGISPWDHDRGVAR
jgi:sugar/nucleoside kinase (ribokinase family)